MNNVDAIDMIQRSIAEIEQLRAEIRELRPQAEAYAAIVKVLNLLPQQSRGAGEDVVWRLKRQLEGLQLNVQMTEIQAARAAVDAAAPVPGAGSDDA